MTRDDRYDPFSPRVIGDPYPYYRRLLEEPPPCHDEKLDLWILARHDDVYRALRSHDVLSSAEGVSYVRFGLPTMLTVDPPEHTRLRRVVQRAFTPKGIERWRPLVDRLAEDAVERLVATGTTDFVETVARPLPVAVIAAILGIPDEDLPALRRISDDIVQGFKVGDPRNPVGQWILRMLSSRRTLETLTSVGMRSPTVSKGFNRMVSLLLRGLEGRGRWVDDVARTPEAVSDLQAYCTELIRKRRREPADDLVGTLLAEHPDGSLTDVEIFWFFLLLIVAGHETTINLLGNMVLALAEHPDQWEALRQDPDLAPAAVNEALRYEAPIQGFFRTAREPYQVGDGEIPANARVLLLFGAANRDPRRYEEPDSFRITRNPTDHLAFGSGVHHCLGARVAEMEGVALLRELVRRVERFDVAGKVRRNVNPTLRGVAELPLRVSERARPSTSSREPRGDVAESL